MKRRNSDHPRKPKISKGPRKDGWSRPDPTGAALLFDEIRQFLDFIMWFLLTHDDKRIVRYEWFVEEFPNGKPGDPGVTAEITQPVLAFLSQFAAWKPIQWTTNLLSSKGEKREASCDEFLVLLRGELRHLNRLLVERTGTLSPWFPRDDLFPCGSTPRELHADYVTVREKLLAYYVKFVSMSRIKPPFYGFPEPVLLSESYDKAARAIKRPFHGFAEPVPPFSRRGRAEQEQPIGDRGRVSTAA